jgi:hypothetical protein
MTVQDLKLLIENLPDTMPVSVMGSEVQTVIVLDNVLILDENPDSFGETGFLLYQATQPEYAHSGGPA